ncbi:MAG: PEP-CTERM sorting domain-containing protein [Pirellulales bacterium]
MRLARLSLVFLFGALVLSKTSFGALLLTANYNLRSEAQDRTLLSNSPIVTNPGGVTLDVNPGPFEFMPEAVADHGTANASVFGIVRAEKGHIGVGFDGSIQSAGGPVVGGVVTNASGGNISATATAGWMEFIVPKVKNKPVGQAFLVESYVVLEGSMGADVTGSTPAGGQVNAYLEYNENSTNSLVVDPPYSGFWAVLHENTTGTHIVGLPTLDTILVLHHVFNGLPYTIDNSMRLLVDANAANGGTASFSADFSTSLKWGGIARITDTDGREIPRDEWSIESESGFDYARSWDAQQVPEPTSILLLGIAMLGLAVRPVRGATACSPAV